MVITKELISRINNVAQDDVHKAIGMVEMLNDECGQQKFAILNRRVVLVDESGKHDAWANMPDEKETENVQKVTFFIGLNDKKAKTELFAACEAEQILINIFCDEFGFESLTIRRALGVYTYSSDDNGGMVRVCENTLEIDILDFSGVLNAAKIRNICSAIKSALNQESVAVARQRLTSDLF